MADPIPPGRPPSQQHTILREARYVPVPTWRGWFRDAVAEALDLPPGQAVIAVASGAAVGLGVIVLVVLAVMSAP